MIDILNQYLEDGVIGNESYESILKEKNLHKRFKLFEEVIVNSGKEGVLGLMDLLQNAQDCKFYDV